MTRAAAGNLTTELDLNDGQTYVAPGVSYQSVYNGVNTTFPVLLTGSADSQFWSLNRSVLEMAPELSYIYGHDQGLMMFDGGSSSQWEISADAVTSTEYNGDGASFYFLLTPVSTANWSAYAYDATVTDGPSLAPCSGDLIFPYSTTPYFVVQWEPAYQGAYCGIGAAGAFNVYAVHPATNGVVTSGSITTVGPIGKNTSYAPGAHDVFNVTVAYEAANNSVQATAVDSSSAQVLADLSYDLSGVDFSSPSGTSIPSYLAVAEGASDRTSWGLEYVAYTHSFPTLDTTPPTTTASPPFTANFTTELDLNGQRNYSAPGLSYQGFYGGTDSAFPVLLTGSETNVFDSPDASTLELAPELSDSNGPDTGLMIFDSANATQWEISADAVTSMGYAGDGVSLYFMLSPTSDASWNSDYYVYSSSCSGAILLPYSTTPYFVVQWDPLYAGTPCGAGYTSEFNVVSVNPFPGGTITALSISGQDGPVGSASSIAPAAHDVVNVTVGYKAAQNELQARAFDVNSSTVLAYASMDMLSVNFLAPFENSIPTHMAVAEGASGQTAWGLEYVGYTTWTESENATEPSSFLTPPGTAPASLGPPSASPPAAPWAAVLFAGVAAALAVSFGIVTIRQRRLRREGEALVAGMNRLISEAGRPPRTP